MTLIAIDMDGTLLNHEGTISQSNKQAMIQAQEAGHQIAISSGRSLHDVQALLDKHGIDCHIIAGNGPAVYHAGERIQHLVIPLTTLKQVIQQLNDLDMYFEIYTNQGVYYETGGRGFLMDEVNHVHERGDELDLDFAQRTIDIQYEQNGLTEIADYQAIDYEPLEVYKLFVLSFDKEKRGALQDYLSKRHDVAVTTSGEQKIEIANQDASKGNGLMFLAQYLGVPLKNTMAIGDNHNDMSMLKVAGTGIAMGNAVDELKAVATHVTKHHDEYGVAYALQTWLSS